MKKKRLIMYILILCNICLLFMHPAKTLGYDYLGVKVYAFIQSYDKELAQGSVYAYTFREALQKLGNNTGVNIIFSQDGAQTSIYSVNGINNSHLPRGGWYGYVKRGEQYLRPDNYLDISLENGDEIVLYYGNFDDTKIITGLTVTETRGAVTFEVTAAYTVWSQSSDKWEKDKIDEKLNDVNIHLIMPGGTRKILKTNSYGLAGTKISKLGMYKFYAENYVSDGIPLAVRTKDSFFFYGVKDENSVTRAEATAFLVNLFNTPDSREELTFTDVDDSAEHYNEIKRATSAGIISGYDDNTFRPDEPVTLLQLAVMLSKVYNGNTEMKDFDHGDLPNWAIAAIKPAVYHNLLSRFETNWYSPVSSWMLQQIYHQI